MKKLLFFLFLGLFILNSCETEIKQIAEYKDITVVYGLLNQSENDHYIKITKAFSGDGNAYTLASDPANFNYADGDLDVKIDAFSGSIYKKTYVLNRTVNEIPKDNGVFSSSDNVLYKFTEPLLNKDDTYKLTIYNKKLDKTITSSTTLTNNPISANFGEMTEIKLANGTGVPSNHSFSVKPKENSGRVRVNFIFNYTEHYTDLTTKDKSVKISLGEQKTSSTIDGAVLIYTLSGNTFFSTLTNEIPASVPNLVKRRINNATLEVIIAGIDLSSYISINEPSTSINQTKPEFTNLVNGLGIFSSRNTTIFYTHSSTFVFPPTSIENLIGIGNDGTVNFDDNTIKKLLQLGLEFCDARNITGIQPPRCTDFITNWSDYNP